MKIGMSLLGGNRATRKQEKEQVPARARPGTHARHAQARYCFCCHFIFIGGPQKSTKGEKKKESSRCRFVKESIGPPPSPSPPPLSRLFNLIFSPLEPSTPPPSFTLPLPFIPFLFILFLFHSPCHSLQWPISFCAWNVSLSKVHKSGDWTVEWAVNSKLNSSLLHLGE